VKILRLALCVVAVFACAVVLIAAGMVAGPIRSGAFWLSSGPLQAPHQHDLPRDYRPLHQGHVELSNGLYVREDEDLVLSGTPPFVLHRTYRTRDRQTRPFGIGASHDGEWYLYGNGGHFQWVELILEHGGRVHFDRVSAGTGYSDALFVNRTDATEFYGARLGWSGYNWILREQSGAVGWFLPCHGPGTNCTLTRWRDADGHVTRFTRDSAGQLRRIDAGAQWITLDYDARQRVIAAQASTGRSMKYDYDGSGRLTAAHYSDNTIRRYDYDNEDRLTRIEEPGRIVRNRYDEHGFMVYQRVDFSGDSEPYIAEARYVINGDRVQTDFLESGEPPVRYAFSARGATESETYDPDTPAAITVTYDRDPASKIVSGVTVSCGGAHRWKETHSLPTGPGSEEQTKADLLSRWCTRALQ
jgi:YD repeat-containing protein